MIKIVHTSKNEASAAIADKLNGLGVKSEDTNAPTVLDVPTDFECDCLLVLSTHKSKNPGKMLTCHLPGNWSNADLGGRPKTLNIAPASMLKVLLEELKREGERIGWPCSLEADHHGPTCTVPIIFVEIGNDLEQWKDAVAADAVANAIVKMIDRVEKGSEKYDAFFGVGGGHYSRFTDFVLANNKAVGHIAPKYAIDLLEENDGEMFKQAIEKNVEKVEKVLVLKDEANAKQKEKVLALANKFGLECEMV